MKYIAVLNNFRTYANQTNLLGLR